MSSLEHLACGEVVEGPEDGSSNKLDLAMSGKATERNSECSIEDETSGSDASSGPSENKESEFSNLP
eukprot:1306384-Amphidinium_carterae.2